jgi:hypothetical protein
VFFDLLKKRIFSSFEPFRAHLTEKFVKNGNMNKNFFFIPHTAIFKPTDFAGTVSCPAIFGSWHGTKDAPLL